MQYRKVLKRKQEKENVKTHQLKLCSEGRTAKRRAKAKNTFSKRVSQYLRKRLADHQEKKQRETIRKNSHPFGLVRLLWQAHPIWNIHMYIPIDYSMEGGGLRRVSLALFSVIEMVTSLGLSERKRKSGENELKAGRL